MLQLQGVTKKFGELVAVNDLSFNVEKEAVYGIAGPNGAGKSTVYNLITGFYDYQGDILFDGKSLSGLAPFKIAKRGIARTFQVPRTFPSLTVEQTMAVGSRFASGRGFEPEYVDELLHFLGLNEERGKMTGRLSLLSKKKLMIGAALATRPKVLMLDEPMAGSNTHEIKELMDIISRINREMKITVVIIEHFMKVLTELTDRLLIIESGKRVCAGDPEEVTSDPEVIECYIGDAYAESG